MGEHILVVDDEPEFGQLVEYGLEATGYSCTLALTGDDGLKLARQLKPAAIILDVMLPDLDGFTICEILRRNTATADIPVLLLTCLGGTISRIHGISAGADAYVTKRFKMADLLDQLRGVIRARRDSEVLLESRTKAQQMGSLQS